MNERDDPNVTTHVPAAPAPSGAVDDLVTTDPTSGAAGTESPHPEAGAPAGALPVVPGYRVLHEIARGGMGRVLAAYDLGLDRDVALKVLLPGTHADRVVRESKITARLPYPGIPPVHALGTLADGSPFLAMKLIARKGEPTRRRPPTGRACSRRLCKCARPLASPTAAGWCTGT